VCITTNEGCKFLTVTVVYLHFWNDVIILLVGGEVLDQSDQWDRFAVILYDNIRTQFVFSARQWSNTASSYICQLQQQGRLIIQPHSILNVVYVRSILYGKKLSPETARDTEVEF